MKSNYLAKASALLNSRIPSLQVSNPPGHQVTGWRTMTLAPPAPASTEPLRVTRVHRYADQVPLIMRTPLARQRALESPATAGYSLLCRECVLPSVLCYSYKCVGRSLQSSWATCCTVQPIGTALRDGPSAAGIRRQESG